MNFEVKAFVNAFKIIARGLPITVSVALAAMLIGFVVGTLIALLRTKRVPIISHILEIYVSFFRGTPLMVQMFIFFYGLPQVMPALAAVNAFQASIIVMSINASAYISEVMRGALAAIDKGQMEAGLAVGMTRLQTLERIVLPQAFRLAIPPLGNTFISLIQGTAITFMLGLKDIMGLSKMQAAASYRFFETYIAVGIVYWLVTSIAAYGNRQLEKRLNYE